MNITYILQNTQNSSYLALQCSLGPLIILINSVQLLFLKTKFKREINTLFVLIRHLSIADLLNGVVMVTRASLSALEWKVFVDSNVVHEVLEFIGIACTMFVVTVSTTTLDSLTVMKMLKITQDKSYREATVKKICYSIWGISFVLSAISYAFFRAHAFSSTAGLQGIGLSLLTFSSVVLQSYCFGRIIYVTQIRTVQVPGRADGTARSGGAFTKIAIFQILAFVVCQMPLSTYFLIVDLGVLELDNTKLRVVGLLPYLHSIVDPAVFFVVYRHKWRQHRQIMSVRYYRRSAFGVPCSNGHLESEQSGNLDVETNVKDDFATQSPNTFPGSNCDIQVLNYVKI